MCFLGDFARFFRTPIFYLIMVCYAKEGVLKNFSKLAIEAAARVNPGTQTV